MQGRGTGDNSPFSIFFHFTLQRSGIYKQIGSGDKRACKSLGGPIFPYSYLSQMKPCLHLHSTLSQKNVFKTYLNYRVIDNH